jgi:phosphatidylinositol alpha-1,6-mannosyltransferase
MKMLWITDNFLPHYGGSRVLYYHTIRCLPPGAVTVLTRRVPGWREFDAGERFRIARGFFATLPGPALLREVPVYAEMAVLGAWWTLRARPEVIVCGELLPAGLIGLILSRMSGRPYIVYVHGEEIGTYERLRGERTLALTVLRSAGAVLPSAREVRDKVLLYGVPPERVHLLTPGIAREFLEGARLPERIRSRYGLGGKRILLTVGRLVERKGHEDVIRSLPEVVREFPDVAYLIVGAGPLEARLKSLARELGVEGRVVFAGRVSREDLPDCYAACEVFVMPNRELSSGDTEGAGIVLLEAAALGKPVVAGRAGGTGDSVIEGETGFRIDPANHEELPLRLRQLLRDRELGRRMGEAGRRMVMTERRWQDRAEELRRICAALTQR